MHCRDCKVEMKCAIALVPTWGTLDNTPIQNGTTLNMVSSKVCRVMKCPQCGHSVYFGNPFILDQK